MKKKFDIPELLIIYFEDDMATNVIPDSGEETGDDSEFIDPE